MKHIVASGCSFTRQAKRINLEGNDTEFLSDWIEMWRWPHWIKKDYEVEVYNMGSATHDNWTIARTTIYKIEKLIQSGVNIKDIYAIIQWSAWTRESFYVSPSKMKDLDIVIENKTQHSHAHLTDWIDAKEFNGQYGYWMLTGGFNLDHVENKVKNFLPDYFEYIKSPEQSFLNHLEAKLYLQNYLTNKGIDWFSFDIQNNFSKSYTMDSNFGFPSYRETNDDKFSEAIFDKKYIPNTWVDDTNYEIELAVAGFAQDEIDVEFKDTQLTIKGEQQSADQDEAVEYLHKGISARAFVRTFTLAEHVEVRDASVANGILTISLEHVVPEAKKPKKIQIEYKG